MRGLEERNSDGNTIFLKIRSQGICQESKEERAGYQHISGTVAATGKKWEKWIKPYKGVEAMVTKIEWYEREFDGKRLIGWTLYLNANGTNCTLDMPFDHRTTGRFMKLAENIDFRKPVYFTAWKDKDDKIAFNVKQGGVTVPQKYTRAEPNGLPEPTQDFKGKWDYSAQEKYLHDVMIDTVIPTVQAAAAISTIAKGQSDGLREEDVAPEDRQPASELDDIPF